MPLLAWVGYHFSRVTISMPSKNMAVNMKVFAQTG